MPMLTMSQIGFPVWPRQVPPRTRLEKSVMRSSTAWTPGTTSSPSTRICPWSGLSSPSTSLIVVDLPQPDPPRIIFVSPFITLKERSFRTLRLSNSIVTLRNSIAGMARSRSSISRNVDSAASSLTRLSMVRSIESCVIMWMCSE